MPTSIHPDTEGYLITQAALRHGEVHAAPDRRRWHFFLEAIDVVFFGLFNLTSQWRFYKVRAADAVEQVWSPCHSVKTRRIEVIAELTLDEFRSHCVGCTYLDNLDGEETVVDAHIDDDGRLVVCETVKQGSRVMSRSTSIDGFTHGEALEYYSDGQLQRREVWDMGVRLECEEYEVDGTRIG